MVSQIDLYKQYFVDNKFERLGLFELLRDLYDVQSSLYLGSFVHITPAFVFAKTAFVDSDKRVQKFFDSPEVAALIETNKQYSEESDMFASQQNYDKPIAIEPESYDLLISQYAGFVSQAGKQYLRPGGILVANNSHADAGMAFLDPDYELVGVLNNTGERWRFSDKSLEDYFLPKKGAHPTAAELRDSMKGVRYSKTAVNYVFRKLDTKYPS